MVGFSTIVGRVLAWFSARWAKGDEAGIKLSHDLMEFHRAIATIDDQQTKWAFDAMMKVLDAQQAEMLRMEAHRVDCEERLSALEAALKSQRRIDRARIASLETALREAAIPIPPEN